MHYEDIKLKQSTYAIISFNERARPDQGMDPWYPGGHPQEMGAAGSDHSGYPSLPLSPLHKPASLTFHQRNQFLKCAQL